MNEEPNVISLDDSTIVAIMKMGKGNPGALTVMFEMVKVKDHNGIIAIMHLDDMNIRGELIWIGYNDYCKRDVVKFIECSINRDKGMLQEIETYKKLRDESNAKST